MAGLGKADPLLRIGGQGASDWSGEQRRALMFG
jgi:hypothetical protein